ncbi:MAG TPA: NAD(P)H-dependent oxidoreductase [Thermomicrobiales bacterium]|nr:NAD(P)H-dependent oxidoreductase [Thermomicrobiales bacterium]
MGTTCRILTICGSLRAGSSNAAVLRTAQEVAPDGVAVSGYDGLAALPHFNPDDDAEPLHPAVADLRARIRAADALLFSTPEYAGALPGSFKNLLDWTVGGGETYGKPAAWINASASQTGAADAHESLRKVLERTGTDIVEAACAHIPVPRQAVGPDGLIGDPVIRQEIAGVLQALAEHCRRTAHEAAAP